MFTAYESFQLPLQERDRLQHIERTTTLSAGLVRRARVLLAEGVSLRQIQEQTEDEPTPHSALEEELAEEGAGRSAGCPPSGAALHRTPPALPLRPKRPERQTVEYVRHGTVSLLAALEVHSGKVVGRCVPRHTSEEFVNFLEEGVATQGMITRDCIRRGVFHSVSDLAHKIMTYIQLYNRNAQPCHWTYRNPRRRIRVSPIFGNAALGWTKGSMSDSAGSNHKHLLLLTVSTTSSNAYHPSPMTARDQLSRTTLLCLISGLWGQ